MTTKVPHLQRDWLVLNLSRCICISTQESPSFLSIINSIHARLESYKYLTCSDFIIPDLYIVLFCWIITEYLLFNGQSFCEQNYIDIGFSFMQICCFMKLFYFAIKIIYLDLMLLDNNLSLYTMNRKSSAYEPKIRPKKSTQPIKKDQGKVKNSKRLVSLIFQLAPKIISFARVFCKKLKKKNCHQILLFPDSINASNSISSDRNENLINEYKKKNKNWYAFYFSTREVYIDNHHLQLFNKRAQLPVDYSKIGIGNVICFGQFVGFTLPNINKMKQQNNSNGNNLNGNGIKLKKNDSKDDSQTKNIAKVEEKSMDLSEIKKRLMSRINSFSMPSQQSSKDLEQGILTKNILFLGTSLGHIIAVDPKSNIPSIKKTQQPTPITSIAVFKNYIMAKTQNILFFYKFQIKNGTFKLNELFKYKIQAAKEIYRPTFFKFSELYFVFFIDDNGFVKKVILKQRAIANLLQQTVICQPAQYNPFTNLKIFLQATMSRLIIIASCTKQVLIYTLNYNENKQYLLFKMPNPKNPPMNPRIHLFSCIQFFSKVDLNFNITDNKANGDMRKNSSMNGFDSTNYMDEEQNQQNLIVAVSFTQRMYFIKIVQNNCQISKRAKFLDRIVKIQSHNNSEGIFIVLLKPPVEIDQKQAYKYQNEKKDNYPQLIVVGTLLRHLMSFSEPINTQIISKIQYRVPVRTNFQNTTSFRASFIYLNQEMLILTSNYIQRLVLNTWQDIYKKMLNTENLQLLLFLILLKNQNSCFLKAPTSFKGLQKFFPTDSDEFKQILIQYYYQIDIQPPLEFIADIIHTKPQLLLPFILEHKISNLSQNIKQMLIQYWKAKDVRIIEELIMAGCQFGWQMAIKQGWMRALRKIVTMGVQIHFPLLKLSTFVVCELKKLQQLDQLGNLDTQYESKCDQIQKKIDNYCLQMIEYALLALEYFLDPSQIQQLEDLKQFISILLRPEILQNSIKYQPNLSVSLISKLFNSQARINLIEKFNIHDFSHYQKQFKHIIRGNYLGVAECLFSYFSQIYYELTQTKNFTNDQKAKFRQKLSVQHAKVIRLQMENRVQGADILHGYSNEDNYKGKFQFTRPYLLQMLGILASHNNENLKELIHEQYIEIEKDRQEYECYMQDLLVKIWMDAKNSPTQNNGQMTKNSITPLDQKQIRDLIAVHEQTNSSNNYLIICFMAELPPNEYCTKILRKFIFCQNSIIQQRLFDWLFPIMKDQQCKQALQNEVMNHLKGIIQINKQKSRELFQLYFRNKQKQIINKIDNDPHLQLEYLEMIIEDADLSQTQVEDYYLNLYLKLLIHQQPTRVIPILQASLSKQKSHKIKYNLQEALRISLQKQNYNQKNRIQMYLYQKIGQLEKCISSYLKILQTLFWEYINIYESKTSEQQKQGEKQEQVQNNDEYEFTQKNRATKKLSIISEMIKTKISSQSEFRKSELEQLISEQFKELTDLIFRQSIKQYDYLRLPLDAMLKFSQEIKQQKLKFKQHYLSMMAYYFGRIIVESFEKNYFQFFNQWLKAQSKIDLNVLKKYLFEGYKKIISHQILLENISEIDKNVLIQNIRDILMKMQSSVYCEAECTVCGNKFQEYQGEATLFNCGHLFHQTCIQQDDNGQDYCWECIYKNQMQAMIDHPQINMVTLIEKYCLKKSENFQQEQKQEIKQVTITKNKKIMNRLGIFDKKISTMDNQAEILQMKLEIIDYYQNAEDQD